MKFHIKPSILLSALEQASVCVASQKTFPVLRCVKIHAEPGTITISSCDLEKGVAIYVTADVIEEGELCLNEERLSDGVACLKSDEMISLTQEGAKVVVRNEGSRSFSLPWIPAADFPKQPEEKEPVMLDAPMLSLRAALAPVLDWYQSDEHPARPTLEIIRDIVVDLQSDRADALALNSQLNITLAKLAEAEREIERIKREADDLAERAMAVAVDKDAAIARAEAAEAQLRSKIDVTENIKTNAAYQGVLKKCSKALNEVSELRSIIGGSDSLFQEAAKIVHENDELRREVAEAEKALRALGYEKHGIGWAIAVAESP